MDIRQIIRSLSNGPLLRDLFAVQPMPKIEVDEIIDLLTRIGKGEVALKRGDNSGGLSYHVYADGWELYFFDDAVQVDYLEFARAPDGRIGEFDDWSDECHRRFSDDSRCVVDPLGTLSDEMIGEVEERVQRACERHHDPFAWTR